MTALVDPRIIPIEGARNLRDAGGYSVGNGRRVKLRRLFRSGHPAGIEPAARTAFRSLGLASILDLRTNEERARQPYQADLLEGLRYHSRDYLHSDSDLLKRLQTTTLTADDVHTSILQTYRALPYEQAIGIGMLFRILLDRGAPVLVNCTAGKDRTGAAIALLLLAIGVSREDVIRDYAMTEKIQDPATAFRTLGSAGPYAFLANIDPAVWRPMLRSKPEYMHALIDQIDEKHGSVAAYLAEVHGIVENDIYQIKDILIE
jgi:protein-tyrosine phosphatase